MDTKVLEYCVALEKHLNFTKAAEECHISQQALSQQIIKLEKQIGAVLFERCNRYVRLTPSGESFINDAKMILVMLNDAVKKSRQSAIAQKETLSFYFYGPYERLIMAKCMEFFHTKYPNIVLDPKQGTAYNSNTLLINNIVDVAFVLPYEPLDKDIIQKKVIFKDYACVAVNKNHRLASKKAVSPHELLNENILWLGAKTPKMEEKLLQTLRDICGIMPNFLRVPNFDTWFVMLQAGLGFTFLPSIMRYQLEKSGLAFLDLQNTRYYSPISLAWKRDNRKPIISLFLDSIDTKAIKSSIKSGS